MNAFQKYLTAMYTYFTLKRVHSYTQMRLLLNATSTQIVSITITHIYLRTYDYYNFFQCECIYNAAWRGPGGHKFCSTE